MEVDTRTDTTVDEELDFAPHCSIIRSYLGLKTIPCEHPAMWVGFLPCCGKAGLVCDSHFKDRFFCLFRCGKCNKTHRDLIEWQKL